MNKRLKILFITTWYPSEENPANGVFVKEHAISANLYNDVVIVAFCGWSNFLNNLFKASDNIENGIRVIRIIMKRLPLPGIDTLLMWFIMVHFFRKIFNDGYKPDIIHAHIYSTSILAFFIGYFYNIPFIQTEQWSGFATINPPFFRLMPYIFAMNKAKMILPVSHALRNKMVLHGVKNIFHIVPNVVNTDLFSPLSDVNIDDINNGKFKLLTVALLRPVKGIHFLLQALHLLCRKRNDITLDIIGDGPSRKNYEELVSRLDLKHVVTFHGIKNKNEIAEFMRRCHFFLLPSLWDSFPCSLIEAMASGKPVIASDVGGIKEIINKKTGILVRVGSIADLVKGIEYMLSNYKLFSSSEISQFSSSNFSYQKIGKTFDDIYHQVLNIETKRNPFPVSF